MKTAIRAFWCDCAAATAVEYALIIFFLSATIIAGSAVIGTKLSAKFTPISGNLS